MKTILILCVAGCIAAAILVLTKSAVEEPLQTVVSIQPYVIEVEPFVYDTFSLYKTQDSTFVDTVGKFQLHEPVIFK